MFKRPAVAYVRHLNLSRHHRNRDACYTVSHFKRPHYSFLVQYYYDYTIYYTYYESVTVPNL